MIDYIDKLIFISIYLLLMVPLWKEILLPEIKFNCIINYMNFTFILKKNNLFILLIPSNVIVFRKFHVFLPDLELLIFFIFLLSMDSNTFPEKLKPNNLKFTQYKHGQARS